MTLLHRTLALPLIRPTATHMDPALHTHRLRVGRGDASTQLRSPAAAAVPLPNTAAFPALARPFLQHLQRSARLCRRLMAGEGPLGQATPHVVKGDPKDWRTWEPCVLCVNGGSPLMAQGPNGVQGPDRCAPPKYPRGTSAPQSERPRSSKSSSFSDPAPRQNTLGWFVGKNNIKN